MVVKAVLVLFLVMAALFAWRAWKQFPAIAVLAAAVAAGSGMLLMKSPALAAVGLLVAAGLIGYLSSRPRP